MTAMALFTIIMTISMGSILSVFDANRKSRSIKTVMTNLNIAVESMSKEMRFGENYHCGGGSITQPQNCASGDTLMSFLSSDDVQITYRFSGTAIEKEVDGDGFIPVTAPELLVDSLTFYTLGADTGNTLQPKVIIKIKAHVGSGKSRADLTLQTLVSQRILDI